MNRSRRDGSVSLFNAVAVTAAAAAVLALVGCNDNQTEDLGNWKGAAQACGDLRFVRGTPNAGPGPLYYENWELANRNRACADNAYFVGSPEVHRLDAGAWVLYPHAEFRAVANPGESWCDAIGGTGCFPLFNPSVPNPLAQVWYTFAAPDAGTYRIYFDIYDHAGDRCLGGDLAGCVPLRRLQPNNGPGFGRLWSEVEVAQALSPPQLLLPARDAVVETVQPELSWTPSAGATGYRLFAARNADTLRGLERHHDQCGPGCIVDGATTPGIAYVIPPGRLQVGDSIYWMVRAEAGAARSGPSEIRRFIVGGGAPGCPSIALTEPADVQSIAPGDLVRIAWDGDDPGGAAVVTVGYDDDQIPGNGTTVLAANRDVDGHFIWNTAGLPEGRYFAYAAIGDGPCRRTAYAPGAVEVGEVCDPNDPGPSVHYVDSLSIGQGTVLFKVQASAFSGEPSIEIEFDGEIRAMDPRGGASFATAFSFDAAGRYPYRVTATDACGRTDTFGPTQVALAWSVDHGLTTIQGGVCGDGNYQGGAGDPVNTHNGNFAHTWEGPVVEGVGGTDIRLDRTYNSQAAPAPSASWMRATDDGATVTTVQGPPQPFGPGWTSPYGAYVLVINEPPHFEGAQVVSSDGRTVLFQQIGGGYVAATPGVRDALERDGDGFVLRESCCTLAQRRFNADGLLTEIVDRNGNAISLTYDGAQLARIENASGRSVTFRWEGGRIAAAVLPDGTEHGYEYVDGRLSAHVDGRGGRTRYEYEGNGLLSAVFTPRGHPSIRMEYDDAFRVAVQTVGDAERRSFSYEGGPAAATTITNAYGHREVHRYDDQRRLVRVEHPDDSWEAFTYDEAFNRTSHRSPIGVDWRWTYDERGNRLTAVGPLGWARAWTYDGRNQVTELAEVVDDETLRVTTFEYDERGNRTSTCNALGDCSAIVYDARGLPTEEVDFAGSRSTMVYDATGDLRSRTDPDGNTYTYAHDALGRLVSEVTPEGNEYRHRYDADGNRTELAGPEASILRFEYDANGNLSARVDPNGHRTNHAHDRSDRLTQVTNPLGFAVTTRRYGAMGELVSAEDAEGRVTTYEYDAMLRLRHEARPLETHRWFAYDAGGNLTDETDARGFVRHIDYDELSRPTRVTQNHLPGAPPGADVNVTREWHYDQVGNVLTERDAEGNPTTYEYDVLGRRIRIEDAEGNVRQFGYDALGKLIREEDPNGFEARRSYTPGHRLRETTDPLGSVTTFRYDGDGRLADVQDPLGIVTRYEYDGLGRRTRQIQNHDPERPADAGTNVTTAYQYDLAGNLRFVTSPRGDRAELRYDAANRLIANLDFAGGETTWRYDRVDNLLVSEDDNGHTVAHHYDALNRRVSTVDPEGHQSAFAYDPGDHLTGMVDRNGNPTTYEVDALGRPTRMLDALGGAWSTRYGREGQVLAKEDANGHVTSYEYDRIYRQQALIQPEGNLTRSVWDSNGNLVEAIDAEGNRTTFVFDGLNRPIAVTNAEDETTLVGYDAVGNQTSVELPDGTVTESAYDALRRLVAVIQNARPGEAPSEDTNVRTTYEYDASGNLVRIINALGQATAFRYDPMGRVLGETDPLGNTWAYRYDGVGNQTLRRDANQAETAYTYYPDDQMRSIIYGDGTRVDYLYDPNNNRTRMDDSLGPTTWAYDALNRLTGTTDPFGRGVGWTYDRVGNRLSTRYPDGNRVSYAYSRNNWLASVDLPAGQWARYERDRVGHIASIENSNNTATEVLRDAVYRVTHLTNLQRGGREVINSAFTYVYNPVGDVVEETATYGWRQPDTERTTYGYDALHRLVGVQRAAPGPGNAGFTASYGYDAVGNRLSWTADDDPATQQPRDGFVKSYVHDAASRMLEVATRRGRAAAEILEFTYDANGNRVDQLHDDGNGPLMGSEYGYDLENRLVSVQDYQLAGRDGGNRIDRALTEEAYDGTGRRLAKTYDPRAGDGGQKRVEYVFDGPDPIGEYERLNGQYTNYYRGDRKQLAVMHHFPAGALGQTYWYHFNRKGDVTGLTKHGGQSHHNYRYDPYGAVLPENGNFQDPHNHYGLTGKENDENTGLTWFGARHYDPATGVWITADPYRGENTEPMSLHRSMYVNNNPINRVDEYGNYAAIVVPRSALEFPTHVPAAHSDEGMASIETSSQCVALRPGDLAEAYFQLRRAHGDGEYLAFLKTFLHEPRDTWHVTLQVFVDSDLEPFIEQFDKGGMVLGLSPHWGYQKLGAALSGSAEGMRFVVGAIKGDKEKMSQASANLVIGLGIDGVVSKVGIKTTDGRLLPTYFTGKGQISPTGEKVLQNNLLIEGTKRLFQNAVQNLWY